MAQKKKSNLGFVIFIVVFFIIMIVAIPIKNRIEDNKEIEILRNEYVIKCSQEISEESCIKIYDENPDIPGLKRRTGAYVEPVFISLVGGVIALLIYKGFKSIKETN